MTSGERFGVVLRVLIGLQAVAVAIGGGR